MKHATVKTIAAPKKIERYFQVVHSDAVWLFSIDDFQASNISIFLGVAIQFNSSIGISTTMPRGLAKVLLITWCPSQLAKIGAPSSSLKFSVVLEIAPNICGLSCYQSVFDIFSLGLNPLELKILSWLLIFTHFWGISVATKSHPLTRIMPATDVSPVWTSSNLRGLCSLNELADVKWIMHTCMYKLSHSLNPKHTPTCFIHSAQVMFDGGGLHDPKCFGATGAGLRKLGSARKVYFNAFIFQPIWMCWAGFCLQWKLHGKPELCLKYGPDSLCIF